MSVLLLQYSVIGLLMDKDIKILEKIGLHDVCKKTHIEVKQLEYMINADYGKLNKINTLGFVKILSREYKIDFTQWLEGFNDYWKEHKSDEDLRKEKIFVRANSDKGMGKGVWIFLIVVLIGGAIAFFSVFNHQIDILELWNKAKSETSITGFQNPPVVQEAATTLGVKVEERVIESNSTNATVEAVVVPIVETQQSVPSNESNETNKSSLMDTPLVKDVPKNQAMIMPTRKIWVGMIALENGTRKESSSDKTITIDLSKRQLIKTGNGYFKLSYDGSIEDFTEQGSTRFLVENGTIKKISEEVFVQMNQGKNW